MATASLHGSSGGLHSSSGSLAHTHIKPGNGASLGAGLPLREAISFDGVFRFEVPAPCRPERAAPAWKEQHRLGNSSTGLEIVAPAWKEQHWLGNSSTGLEIAVPAWK
eukprot:scaffold7908_cov101-Isochrysis_galbana.AAC.1